MKESEHHVFPSQAEGKRQAGLGEGEEPQRGPSEEGGGLFRPQREAGWLQEADAAGPEGGARIIGCFSLLLTLLTADTAEFLQFCFLIWFSI